MSVSPGTSSPATRRSRLAGRLLSMFKVTAVENILTYSPRVLRYARPYWPLLAVSAAILAASAAVGLATPWPLKILIDTALGTQPLPRVLDRAIGRFVGTPGALVMAIVIAEFTIALLLHGLGVLSNYTTAKLSLGMTLDFRKDLFDHTQRLSLSFHDRRKSGMNLYRIDYFDSAPPTFLVTVMPLVQSLFTLVGMFYISFLIDRQLALLSLVVVPFLYYSVGYYSKRIRNQIIDVRNLEGDTMAIIYEALAMMRVVTAFGREDYELRRLSEQGEVSNAARLNLTLRQSLFSFAV
jgi:ABC-type multidrug transport system fused ATPase/permease subunit